MPPFFIYVPTFIRLYFHADLTQMAVTKALNYWKTSYFYKPRPSVIERHSVINFQGKNVASPSFSCFMRNCTHTIVPSICACGSLNLDTAF